MIGAEVLPGVIPGQRLQGEAQVGAGGHSLPEGWVDVPPQVSMANGQKLVPLLPVDLSHFGSGGGEVTLQGDRATFLCRHIPRCYYSA